MWLKLGQKVRQKVARSSTKKDSTKVGRKYTRACASKLARYRVKSVQEK